MEWERRGLAAEDVGREGEYDGLGMRGGGKGIEWMGRRGLGCDEEEENLTSRSNNTLV